MTVALSIPRHQTPVVQTQPNGVRPRVLLFTDSFSRGGTERQFVRLARSLDRSQYDILIACLQRRGPLLSEVESLGVSIVEFPINSLYNFQTAKLFVQLVRFLFREQIQILHAFDFYTSVFAVPAARMAGVPVVLASRRELLNLRSPWQQRAIRVACKLATGVVVNSRAAGHDLAGLETGSRRRIKVLPNCIDLQEFEPKLVPGEIRRELGLTPNSIVVGALGNLRPEKDLGTFLLAATDILNAIPSAQFLVIGDGPARDSLKRLAGDFRISESVYFLNDRSDVPDLVAALDILVMSSYTESSPNAILEAMTMGKPVVATNVGGVPELVEEGHTGFLVPPRDPKAIADRVLYLCRDSARRLQMGRAARLRVESNFTVQEVTARLEGIYAGSLRERCGSAPIQCGSISNSGQRYGQR
jgi:glycosyltransferase involved in cell wall biosynthesis